jgi:threonine/homoserine/homoserine lactone efflux protein
VISLRDWLLFAAAALGMALTPGPNMVYLVSRSITQGRKAGLTSLLGVVCGFLFHILCAAAGLTAMLLTVPVAYATLRYAGAAYLAWLAWQALRPGAAGPLAPRALPPDPPWRLFRMGFLTNAMNPKMAVFYLAIFPQFVHPEDGSVFLQSLQLGLTQMAISFAVNLTLVWTAGSAAALLRQRPSWARLQRRAMGAVLGGLAVRLALDDRR